MTVEPLGPGCLEEVRALLAANQLPVSDLTDRIELLGIWREERLVGVIGLEPYGDVGLLRSLAVDASVRGAGLGGRLVERLESLASSEGMASLYLLTTTAESFFEKRGYRCIPRESAPPAIRETSEFSSICPTSSAFMCKDLA